MRQEHYSAHLNTDGFRKSTISGSVEWGKEEDAYLTDEQEMKSNVEP